MESKFTPENKVINDPFAREVRYVSPEYQRPYSRGCEGKSDKDNQVNNELNSPTLRNVLLHAGNSRYTLNFLLAAWRYLDGREGDLLSLVNACEVFLLHKCLKGRFVSAPVYGATSNLKEGKIEAAIAALAPLSVKQKLKDKVSNGNLDNDAAKLLLCKWVWPYEPKTSDDLSQQKLDFGKASLEHIIPQSPQQGTNWTKDFNDEFLRKFTCKLDNMTLLTGRLNSKARNYDFLRKKSAYIKTKLPITQELARLPSISPEYLTERHQPHYPRNF
jgi:hypothetical protein